MKHDLFELLDIAKHAASLAAAVHRQAIQQGNFEFDTKASLSDLVTEVDRESERELVRAIHAVRPSDAIVGEEGANTSGSSGVRWILDPLDGTTNFVHRYPGHSVAVGVEVDGQNVVGEVHDTFNDRVYTGIVGEGATCNGKPFSVRNECQLKRALIGSGFLPDDEVRRKQADLLREILPRVRDIRRSGCPSLDICSVASGTLDGFYECGLGLWDISAASAIAKAAGATVSLLNSRVFPNPFLVVANDTLTSEVVRLLVECGAVEPPS